MDRRPRSSRRLFLSATSLAAAARCSPVPPRLQAAQPAAALLRRAPTSPEGVEAAAPETTPLQKELAARPTPRVEAPLGTRPSPNPAAAVRRPAVQVRRVASPRVARPAHSGRAPREPRALRTSLVRGSVGLRGRKPASDRFVQASWKKAQPVQECFSLPRP